MTKRTAAGKLVCTITIDPEARAELKLRGIPVGAAAALWLKNIDGMREKNQELNYLHDNIAKMQTALSAAQKRIEELETAAAVSA